MAVYTTRERWLPCDQCVTPVQVPIGEGTATQCPRCGESFDPGPRPDLRIPPTPISDERGRIERLRAQDGKPTLPPEGYAQLVIGSDVPPHKMQDATMVWNATRKFLRERPDDLQSAERLVWLTMVMRNSIEDERLIRMLLEGALEALALPSLRQHMLGHLMRGAAKERDTKSAREWYSYCDPNSEDLKADSAYRVSRALVETVDGDFGAVIELLGPTEESIPIDDAMDAIAVVLRANALERSGSVDAARAELTKYMARGKITAIEGIVGSMPIQVCTQSIEVARKAARQASGDRAASSQGATMGYVMIVAGLIGPGVIFFTLGGSGGFEPIMLVSFLPTLILTTIGVRMISRGRRAKEIATHGLHGFGKIVGVERTGTKINGVPLMQMNIEVHVEGHTPVMASARRLMQNGGAGVQGMQVSIIWHPKYPSEVVVDDGR